MPTSFEQHVSVPSNVMFRELEGESVILDLDSESYFGLDPVGTRMWQLVTEANSIQSAYDALVTEYDVAPETLREDLLELLDTLQGRGLIEIGEPPDPEAVIVEPGSP